MPRIPAPASRHPLRWIVLAIVAVLAALLLDLAIHVHRLLQPERYPELRLGPGRADDGRANDGLAHAAA